VLDTQLENNMGTVSDLADKAMSGTDWTVGGSEHFVEQIEESLVYV
jgi:hypothetical protein